MSSTLLEVTRASHEEIERFERLIVKDLQKEPSTSRERLSQNHRVRSMIDTIIAPKTANKEVALKPGNSKSWNWRSVNDMFLNGASFSQTGKGPAWPHYNRQQRFGVARARAVRSLTVSAGALQCSNRSRC